MSPSSGNTQEGAERFCSSEQAVDTILRRGVIAGTGQDNTDVRGTEERPRAVCKCELCKVSKQAM